MEKSYKQGIFNAIFKFFSQLDAKYWSGFLGQVPTDIWSRIYTSFLRLAGAKIEKGSIVHYKVKIWKPENIEIGKGVRIPASTDMAGMGKIKIGDYSIKEAN